MTVCDWSICNHRGNICNFYGECYCLGRDGGMVRKRMRGWGERSYIDGVKVGTKLGSTSTAAANHNQGSLFYTFFPV